MTLTKTERILLISSLQTLKAQLRLLKKAGGASPEDGPTIEGCDFAIAALERGFSIYYSSITSAIGASLLEKDEMSREKCVFTLDVLDMFLQLKDYRAKYPDDETAKAPRLDFDGFDGNYEGEYAALAEFAVEHGERYRELGLEKPGDFMAHCPMIPRYRRMVERWRESPNRARLTREDVEKIIQAAKMESSPEVSCAA